MTMQTLIQLGDATTCPDPNSLTVKDPYGSNGGQFTPQDSWVSQGRKALILAQPSQAYHFQPRPRLDFTPTTEATTYTVTVKRFNRVTGKWHIPKDTPAATFTGSTTTYLDNVGSDPWMIMLSSVTAGQTVWISYDGLMRAI